MLHYRGKPPPIILTDSFDSNPFLSPRSRCNQSSHKSNGSSSDANSPESEEERIYLSVVLSQITSSLPLISFDAWTAASVGDQSYFDANVDGSIFAKNRGGWTPLMYASFYGHVGVVRTIVVKAVVSHVNEINYSRRSALMLAAAAGHASVLELLLAFHADMEVRDIQDWTALLIAACAGNLNAVQVLLKYGANVNSREGIFGQTALYLAALNGCKEMVALLLKYRADPQIGTFHQDTPLNAALRNGRTATAALLSNTTNTLLAVPSLLIHGPIPASSAYPLKVSPQNFIIPPGKQDLKFFLRWHNLEGLVPLFEAQDVDWEVFLTMNMDDFTQIGIRDASVKEQLIHLVQQCQASQLFYGDLRHFQNVWSHLKLLLLKLSVHVLSPDLIQILAEGDAFLLKYLG